MIATVDACRRFDAPLLHRGGGTSLAGQCCNVAVVLDMSKYMHRIAEMNPREQFARVEPGIVLDDLRRAVRHHPWDVLDEGLQVTVSIGAAERSMRLDEPDNRHLSV